jgi:hypothetical protein
MDASHILEALQEQKDLLEHFIGLSKQHLLLWEDEDLTEHGAVLETRADLMSALREMSEAVSIRIRQIHADPRTGATSDEVRQLNEEIIAAATHIMDIDETLRQDLQRSAAGGPKRLLH